MQYTWPFPAFAEPQRTYIDLKDFLGLIWLRRRPQMQVCAFCRTAEYHQGKLRCDVCGTLYVALTPSRPSVASHTHDRKASPAGRITGVMGRTLLVPLGLFAAFAIWYTMHPLQPVNDVRVPQTLVLTQHDNGAADSFSAPDIEAKTPASDEFSTEALAFTGKAESASALTKNAQAAFANGASAASLTKARASLSRLNRTQRGQAKDVALQNCAERNILMRAICVNNVCAQPSRAGHPQCSEAVAQRRIDEDRRNLVLAN